MLLPVHHSHHYSASIFVHISASSDDFCSHFSKYEDIMIQTELPATICSPILQSSQSFLHYIHALVLLLSLNRWSTECHYRLLWAADRHMLGPRNGTSSPKISLPPSHIHSWENETGCPLSHHLHYIPRCVTEKANCLKTNGHSILLLLVSPIIKVHKSFTSCEKLTRPPLSQITNSFEEHAKAIMSYIRVYYHSYYHQFREYVLLLRWRNNKVIAYGVWFFDIFKSSEEMSVLLQNI